ncbi:CDP-alcohol phosphatidyltransferase family protein [Methyloceanibacter sp.]|uniref:CDP-alcohol phosphatidyltransferase family protein n=1 Tax=Methyloceanibacter sp. TaxID=1965321 RepID=UPI003D6D3CCD
MSERVCAAAVHLLTATGAAFALLALIGASRGDWQWMFLWLGTALIVDTVDGPLARRVGVVKVLPRFSGERLDLIVDFLTYVAVPAFALSQSDLLPEAFRLASGIAVILSSLFHMADQESKTKDGYFVGFPAIWNVVLLYLFAFTPAPFVSLFIVAFFVVLTFVPILCVHPVRVVERRPVTMLVTVLWAVAAIGAAVNPFPSPLWVRVLLLGCAAYLVGAGALHTLRDRKAR